MALSLTQILCSHLNKTGKRTVGVTEGDVDGSLHHLGPGVVAERVLPCRPEDEDLPYTEHDGRPGTPRTEVSGTAHEVSQQLAGGLLATRAVLRVKFVMDQEEGEPVEFQPLLTGLPATVEEIISVEFLQKRKQYCSQLSIIERSQSP